MKFRYVAFRGLGLMTVALVPGGEPWAVAQHVAGTRILDAVSNCRGVDDTARRLDCFEQAARALDTARTEGAILLTREDQRELRQARFGFHERVINPANKVEKPSEIDMLDSSVTRVGVGERDRFVVTFADGTVWRTIEPARLPPQIGDTVHVRRGALGSYLGSFSKMRSIRIERVR